MRNTTKIKNELHTKILTMRKQNYSIENIAFKFKVSPPSVSRILKMYPFIETTVTNGSRRIEPPMPKNIDLLYAKWS